MPAQPSTRREFLRMMGIGAGVLGTAGGIADCGLPIGDSHHHGPPIPNLQSPISNRTIDEAFFVRPEELTLCFRSGRPERRLSFDNFQGSPEAWKKACRDKLAELLGLSREKSSRRAGSQPMRGQVASTNAWVKDPPYNSPGGSVKRRGGRPEGGDGRDSSSLQPPASGLSQHDPAAASGDALHADARLLRATDIAGVKIEAWVMTVDESLSIPAYLLTPESICDPDQAIVAIHGHGAAEPCVGLRDDYHHRFALELAGAGHIVLCPALRGFGTLADMAFGDEGRCLDYWRSQRGRQFTLISDALLYGRTLIGETVADLLRWEDWLARTQGIRTLDVAGISYGGDLALTYPPFSDRVRRIYSSGSLGSFAAVFARCYNAPAHGIPGILNWMDRSDIAGLNAPRPIQLHYGENDTPGPRNNSAAYNETVEPALAQLKRIYQAFGALNQISFKVTTEAAHEIDNEDLQDFLAG